MPRIDPIIHVSFSRSCDKSRANHPRLFSKIHGIRYTRFNLKSVYGVVKGLVETVGRENVTGYSNVLSTRSWSNIEMINPNVAKRCPAIVTEINSVSSRSTVDGYRRCFLIWYRLPASKRLLFFYRSFFFAFFPCLHRSFLSLRLSLLRLHRGGDRRETSKKRFHDWHILRVLAA